MENNSFLSSSTSLASGDSASRHRANGVFTIEKELEATGNKAFKKINNNIIEIPWASFVELPTREICNGEYMIRTKNYCIIGDDDWYLETPTENKFLMIEFVNAYFKPLELMGVPSNIIWANDFITNLAMLNVYKVFWRNEDGSVKDSIYSSI